VPKKHLKLNATCAGCLRQKFDLFDTEQREGVLFIQCPDCRREMTSPVQDVDIINARKLQDEIDRVDRIRGYYYPCWGVADESVRQAMLVDMNAGHDARNSGDKDTIAAATAKLSAYGKLKDYMNANGCHVGDA